MAPTRSVVVRACARACGSARRSVVEPLVAGAIELERFLMGRTEAPIDAIIRASGFRLDAPGEWCLGCGRTIRVGLEGAKSIACDACTASPPGSLGHPCPIIRLARYEGPIRDWILEVKHGRWEAMALELGDMLASQWRRLVTEVPALMRFATAPLQPVPMPWLRRFDRGCDHARLIATGMSAGAGVPLLRVLSQRWRRPQARSSGALRRRVGSAVTATVQAIEEARFQPSRGRPLAVESDRLAAFTRGPVILVDDVMTTGSTLRHAAETLRNQGFGPVAAAVVAVSHDDPAGGRLGSGGAKDLTPSRDSISCSVRR